ncbi:MAG TPA: class I SAM-dependent methyltransferase [Candidatus Polarisedimenticolia bacterium]|jgi:SAM-dependent methyltransferase
MDLAIAAACEGLRPTRDPVTLLDIGGRGRPYAAIAAGVLGRNGHRVRHVVVDPGSGAQIIAVAESLPIAAGVADVVLCTQVLEHVAEPERAVAEMARVLRPGGACLLTTHGTWFYHPDPEDYWRWTPAGLERIFALAGFSAVKVSPVGGTKLALTVLTLTALERAAGEGAAGTLLRRLLVAPANWLAWRLLRGRVTGRASQPGDLVIDYLVVATRT